MKGSLVVLWRPRVVVGSVSIVDVGEQGCKLWGAGIRVVKTINAQTMYRNNS